MNCWKEQERKHCRLRAMHSQQEHLHSCRLGLPPRRDAAISDSWNIRLVQETEKADAGWHEWWHCMHSELKGQQLSCRICYTHAWGWGNSSANR